MDATNNEAGVKFCEVAKALGVSDETIDLIKKDLNMVDDDAATEPEVTGKPEAKVVEVSVSKVDPMAEKKTAMMDMVSNLVKAKA